jgi:hypothetical protein
MPSTAGATISIPPARAVDEVYQREVSSETAYTIYNSRKSIPDGERFLQALNGRFLYFAPISYVSPQNSCRFDLIYHQFDMAIGVDVSRILEKDGLAVQREANRSAGKAIVCIPGDNLLPIGVLVIANQKFCAAVR